MNRLESIFTASDSPRLVSVLSGKGGVGKSIVALNLAERLAAAGQQVLLVDADFTGGNLHILANAGLPHGLNEYASGRKPLDQSISAITDMLHLLAHSESTPLNQLLSVGEAAEFANHLRLDAISFDMVVIDHSSGISEAATILASASDLNLLIAVPELTSLADCYGLYKYLVKSNPAVACRLLVNRTEGSEEAEYVSTRLAAMSEQFLGRPLEPLGYLPEDSSVRRSVAGQRPISQVELESPVVQRLNEIATRLTGEPSPIASDTQFPTINENAAPADIRG